MDKIWISARRDTIQYVNGVEAFLKHCQIVCENVERIPCPCIRCGNYSFVNIRTLYDHLIINGIDQSYQKWIHHGENHGLEDDSNVVEGNSEDMNVDAPHIAQMVDDLQDEPFDNPDELCSLLSDAETPLYPGCVKFTKISCLIRLFNLKTKFGSSDVMFQELLTLLSEMLPEKNQLSSSLYEAKKTLAAIGLGYKKIHACPNDCILYRKEYENLQQCPVCEESRWKKKNDEQMQSTTP
ncbi:MAG: hypothetical protein EOP45_19760, partial [Sphingobacteriaceae bacterium]